MKKILIFLAITAIVSCSKDDDSDNQNTDEPAVETTLYVTSAKVEFTNTAPAMVIFGYNDAKELTALDIATVHYDITYQNGYVKTIVGNNNNVEFTYNNNIITSLSTNGVATDVEFDGATNKYSLTNSSYTINQYGDLTLTEFLNTPSTYYGYDTSKNGAIFNYPIKNPFWIFALVGGSAVFSIKPCTNYGAIEIEHTFNSDGYLTKAVYREAGELVNTVTYTYSEL